MSKLKNAWRLQVTQAELEAAILQVVSGLSKRLAKHGRGAYVSDHEALGVIAEEYHELVDAARSNEDGRVRFDEECMAVAIACLFATASKRARENEQ